MDGHQKKKDDTRGPRAQDEPEAPASPPSNGDNTATATPGSDGRVVHDVQDMSVADSGVQMFVSNQAGHSYQLRNITAGEHGWQCLGTWSDDTIQSVARIIGDDARGAVGRAGAVGGQAGGSGFGRPGRPLGGGTSPVRSG